MIRRKKSDSSAAVRALLILVAAAIVVAVLAASAQDPVLLVLLLGGGSGLIVWRARLIESYHAMTAREFEQMLAYLRRRDGWVVLQTLIFEQVLMATAARAADRASAFPAFWIRRSIALILSPVGLLLISVTRLLIVADYNTTTATAIASSGGYVNTLLGTVIPLVPVFLPYLAIVLLVFRRFILSALTFGATVLISPTRLAPLTALNSFKENWNHVSVLISANLPLTIAVLGSLLIIMTSAFGRAFGRGRMLTITLALLATAFLLPYVLYVYPFPKEPSYYEQLISKPWLPSERITVKSGSSIVGYVLIEDDHWMTVLKDAPRIIQYISVDDVISRSVCQVNSQEPNIPQSPLFPLMNPKLAQLPPCSAPSPNVPGSTVGQQSVQWTAREATRSSRRFGSVSGLSNQHVCARGGVTVTVSIELNGAPAIFRVRIDRSQIMEPGAVRFVPVGANDSFSFTFVQDLRPFDGLDQHVLQLQWRSPCGIATNLERATIVIRYQAGSDNC